MNNKIKQALVWYINMTAQCAEYGWRSTFSVEELKRRYNKLQETIREEDPDFLNMSIDELGEYGFIRWNSESDLMLVPLYLMACLKEGTELICIDGTKHVVGEDYIDNDTRMGCIAYGIYPKGR